MSIRQPTRSDTPIVRQRFEEYFGDLSSHSEEEFERITLDTIPTLRINDQEQLCRVTYQSLAAERPPLPFAEGDMVTEVGHLLPENGGVSTLLPLLIETLFQSSEKYPESRAHPVFAVLRRGNDPAGILMSNGVEKAQAWKRAMDFDEIKVLASPTGTVGFAYAPHLGHFLAHIVRMRP